MKAAHSMGHFDLATALIEARKATQPKMSQADVAVKVFDISPQAYGDWERNKAKPGKDKVFLLAEHLKQPYEIILEAIATVPKVEGRSQENEAAKEPSKRPARSGRSGSRKGKVKTGKLYLCPDLRKDRNVIQFPPFSQVI